MEAAESVCIPISGAAEDGFTRLIEPRADSIGMPRKTAGVTMSISPLDYLVHFSNILLLVSYSVRDILWLRWFAVAAALTNMPYFLLQKTILWPPILWAMVFTAINLYQIARVYMERRPVVLSPDEKKLYELGF